MSDLETILQREAEIAESEPEEEEYSFARPRPAREPSQVYSIRIPVKHLDELRELATSRGVAVSALLREWILERLHLEKRLTLPPHLDAIRDHIVHDVLEEIPISVARSVSTVTNAILASLEAADPRVTQDQAEALAQLLRPSQHGQPGLGGGGSA